ncbi:Os09g0455000 [Oryza sativa Japonica Group]|uniref:Os09g0455000 protein n=2 Tax=Oryza sativa subsp. japonica TaxID=39947 RepID=Q0J196_ORYSJ|nr:Os09g0455000 [Oryza sativa Japonica Group]BAT08419.1 Os09g0455000 [Oryza sativa Japonica Group]|eukprot:NP_001063355.1 Os09g0455000 [Oryza sativa Japonica Group]
MRATTGHGGQRTRHRQGIAPAVEPEEAERLDPRLRRRHAAFQDPHHGGHARPQRRVLVKAAERDADGACRFGLVDAPLQPRVDEVQVSPLLMELQCQHREVLVAAAARATRRRRHRAAPSGRQVRVLAAAGSDGDVVGRRRRLLLAAVLPPVYQLEQHHAEAVDVGAVGDGRVADPLGREVPARAAHGGEQRRLLPRHQLGEAEVRDLHLAAVGEQDVLRLDVAVHDLLLAPGVQVRQPARRADRHLHALPPLQHRPRAAEQ